MPKRNFEAFKATDFLAAAIDHIPPRGQQCSAAMSAFYHWRSHTPHGRSQTIRYYGLYSNKSRGLPRSTAAPTDPAGEKQPGAKPPIVPPPPKATARAMRPLWRDLILRVWGADPLQCPCCQATMKCVGTIVRPGEVQFFLRLHGLWEWKRSEHRLPQAARRQPEGWSGSDINRSSTSRRHRTRPSTSKNAEGSEAFWTQAKPESAGRARRAGRANQTFEPIEPPWQAIREWIPDDDAEPGFDLFDQRTESGKPVEIPREDGSILVLDSD